MAPENRTKAGRTEKGRFVKGISGNAGGRPKVVAEVRDLAREHTADAIATLATLSRTADSDAARVAACKELLDRGWGKAPQAITGEVTLQSLTDEQLEARFKAVMASLAPKGGET